CGFCWRPQRREAIRCRNTAVRCTFNGTKESHQVTDTHRNAVKVETVARKTHASSVVPALRVEDLRVRFRTPVGALDAVDGVSFSLYEGETLGLVGESGSGKTVTSLALLRLLESPPAEISAGSVIFNGSNLLQLPERAIADLRGSRISMIFQEP